MTTASVQDYLAAIYDLAGSGKPVIGARLAKHMGISAPAVTEADPAHDARRLREDRTRQGARAHAERHEDRRGHGPTPSSARALAHRHARVQLDGRPRGGASARARHLAARGGSPGGDAGHADHVPARQSHPGHGPAPSPWSRSRSRRPRKARTVVVERITEEAEADKNLLEHLWRNDVRPGRRLRSPRWRRGRAPSRHPATDRRSTLGLPAATKIWVYLPTDSA